MPSSHRLVGALVAFLAGCSAAPTPAVAPAAPVAAPIASGPAAPATIPAAAPSSEAFPRLRDRVVALWLDDDPANARYLGFHEYDGRIAGYSAKAIADRITRWRTARADLDAIDPSTLPDADDRLDLAILRQTASQYLFTLAELEDPRHKPQFYEELFTVNVYIDRPYAPLEKRAEDLVRHEEAALAEVAHVYENLTLPMSKPVAETAARNYLGFAEYLRTDVAKLLSSVGGDAFRARFRAANDRLAGEAEKLGRWLKTEVVPSGDSSHVLGEKRYLRLLEVQEGLTLDLAAFEKIGEDHLAAMKRAWADTAPTAKVTRPKATELLTVATGLLDEARRFIEEKAIVTIPTKDTALVRETPPYKRWNAASIESSGPFDPTRSSFYYITLPNPSWPKKEREAYVMSLGSLVGTSVHEVYPGHFVQERWVERAPTKVQKMAASYSFTEGWAHYSEQLMVEEGFRGGDPQIRLGQIEGALQRACRFVVSVGMHTKGMTLMEAERRFREDCKQDHATAHEQAVRGTFDPGYFAYTLGKSQILDLRAEAKRALGGRFSLRAFHDALLSHGSPPVPLVRDRVLRELGASK